jgi:PEP-CTERM motif
MTSSDRLPSAADLDAIMEERELLEVASAESEPQTRDSSHRLACLDLRKDSLLQFCFVLVALLIGSATLSANTLPVVFNNGGSNVMGGVYVGPYNLTVGGQSMQLVCDDFTSNVIAGETWNAVTSTYPTLSNVKFSGLVKYQEIGYLVQQMFANISNSATVGYISWAIWDIFNPGVSSNDPYGTLTLAQQSQINGWLTKAANNYSTGNYSNLVIYTPVAGSQVPFGAGPPQEYIGFIVSTPEPPTVLLLGLGLASLFVLLGSKKVRVRGGLESAILS